MSKIINLNSQTDFSSFYVVYDGSAQNEKEGNRGISHLMEHLVCENIFKMNDELSSHGISWNAFTSDSKIVFHFNGLDEYVNKYKYIFLDSLMDFDLNKERFESERNVVIQEYLDVFNTQSYSHYYNLMRKLYSYYTPIGSKKDLEQITYQDCLDSYEFQFKTPFKIINVSKYNDFDLNKVKTKFDFKETADVNVLTKNQLLNNDFEIANDFKGKASICNISNVVNSDHHIVDFIASLLGKGLSSPLYEEIRNKKSLAYYVHCYIEDITDTCGLVNIATVTTGDNANNVQECIAEILSNPEKYITKERFDTVKKQIRILLKKEEIERYKNVNHHIINNIWSLEGKLEDITYEQTLEVYLKYFNFDKYDKSIDSKEFKFK